MVTQADIARKIAVFQITELDDIERRAPYPGQRYRHGWIPVAAAALLTGQGALDAVPLGLGSFDSPLSASERRSLAAYSSPDHFRDINGALRAGERPDGEDGRIADDMDAAMVRSRIGSSVMVYRGMHGLDGFPAVFGDLAGGDMTGLEWREEAFSSTSVRRSLAQEFSGSRGVLLQISVPSGTGALKMQRDEWDREGEVILERGLRMRVTQDHGVDPDWGHRVLDVEVVAG